MAMSTQTLDQAARLMEKELLLDMVQVYSVSEPATIGTKVFRRLTAVGKPVPGLVQSVSLESPVDGRISQSWVVKVGRRTPLAEGMAVKLMNSRTDPDLVGKAFLVDSVSSSSLAMIRKGTATVNTIVNQQGKEVIQ
jgi:hypothetical protein